MPGNLKIIAEYGTPEEAHLLRNRLEAAGIQGFLENETTAAWAWHFSNALGGVKLLVAEEDFEAARAVLAPSAEQPTAAAQAEDGLRPDRPSDSWTCPKCRATVDAGMDVCWACGTTAEGMQVAEFEEEPSEPEPKEEKAPPPDVAFLTVLFPPTFAFFLFSKLCRVLAPLVPDAKHYAPAGSLAAGDARGPGVPLRKGTVPFSLRENRDSPLRENRDSPQGVFGPEAGEVRVHPSGREGPADERVPWSVPEKREFADDVDLDALVLRAWRAALMGFFLLPPLVMTLYSTWLVVTYWLTHRQANRRRDRRALWALAVNVIAALCLGLLLSLAIGRYHASTWHEPDTFGPVEQEPAPYLEP